MQMSQTQTDTSQESGRVGKLYWKLAKGRGLVAPPAHARRAEVPTPGGADVVAVKFNGPGDAPSTTTSTDLGGPKLSQSTRVNLIFWGGAWNSNPQPNPSAQTIVNDAASILAGPYLSSLSQYNVFGITSEFGGIGNRAFLLTSSNPPATFNTGTIANFIVGLIDNGTLDEPDEEPHPTLNCVFMPPGVNYVPPPGTVPLNGAHTYAIWNDTDLFDLDTNQRSHFAWVRFGSRALISSTFSHELVEALTDPEGNAVQVNPTNPTNWNEIGDVCATTGAVNGVTVQSYWSQQDQACVIPNNLAVRRQITCIRKPFRHDAFHPLGEVGGIDLRTGLPFRMSQKDCIREIDGGNPFFVVGADGSQAPVGVFMHFPPGHPEGTRYIATLGDSSKADNLLSLPECPP
jgi:hypothetical protein